MSEYRIDLSQVDALADYERRAQQEQRERMGGLRAACFVALCIAGTIAFGFGWAALEIYFG